MRFLNLIISSNIILFCLLMFILNIKYFEMDLVKVDNVVLKIFKVDVVWIFKLELYN